MKIIGFLQAGDSKAGLETMNHTASPQLIKTLGGADSKSHGRAGAREVGDRERLHLPVMLRLEERTQAVEVP